MSARKLLIHACCGPCLIAPWNKLKGSEYEATVLWYNPNIHPYQEYLRRRDTLKDYVASQNIPIIWQDEYDLELFLKATEDYQEVRCTKCYELRLMRTAQVAMGKGFDAFTTTLLYSKYQRHDDILETGSRIAKQFGLEFYYADWRELWQQGIDLSKDEGMYRQPYCGCIFSEKERYWKPGMVLV